MGGWVGGGGGGERPILMSCSRPSLTGLLGWTGLVWSGIGLDWDWAWAWARQLTEMENQAGHILSQLQKANRKWCGQFR